MTNLRRTVERLEAELGETVEAFVVGPHYNARFGVVQPDEGVLLSRAAGLAKLDYEYDSGFGGADCHPFYAWTASWVLRVDEYDGATGVECVPRHPVDTMPGFG